MHAGTSVPVGPFVVEFDVDAGYAIGGTMSGGVTGDGLAVNLASGPVGKVWVEVRAGVGVAAFTAGVGGHLDLIGGAGGKGNGQFTIASGASYGPEPKPLVHLFTRNVDTKMFFLSGNFFVFAEALWERFDIELFDWNGLAMPAAPEAIIGDEWPIDREPDYGAMVPLYKYQCALGDGRYDGWSSTVAPDASNRYPGTACTLQGTQGNLVSNFVVGAIPLVECHRVFGAGRGDHYLMPIPNSDLNPNQGALPPDEARMKTLCSEGTLANPAVSYALTAHRENGIKMSDGIVRKTTPLHLCQDKKGERYAQAACSNDGSQSVDYRPNVFLVAP